MWFSLDVVEASTQHDLEVGQELQSMLNDNNLLRKLKSSDFDARTFEGLRLVGARIA